MKIYPAAIAAMITLASCGSKSEDIETAAIAEEELPIVEVGLAHSQTVQHSRSYTANIEAENINNISPATMNRIKEIRVDVGDQVRRGQVLATLDSSTADQLRINLENTEREYNRAVELLNIGAGTQRQVDQLKAQMDAQRSQYENAMTNTVLTSPINGVVTARNYDPGDMSGQLPILTVGQITPAVKAVINVNESDVAHVKGGMDVELTFDAFPGETFQGRVSRVSPAIDVASRTLPVEVSVQNPSAKILPGMFARVSMNVGAQDNVVVPDRAVVKQTGSAQKYVYTYNNGTVNFRHVELGERIGDTYELLSGIEDGDTVVISGQTRLTDGARVELKKAEK
ncbi:MAG: efflux RND transporter periplasmic adaptor subunit [Muribaculaceae bacterium]|nr:efflux RND transporter periplasmic adaptor subunit [Muribaculaceae bacterium]